MVAWLTPQPPTLRVLEATGGDAAPVVVALAAGKPTNVAVVACLHTLLTLLNALRKRQTRWQPALAASRSGSRPSLSSREREPGR